MNLPVASAAVWEGVFKASNPVSKISNPYLLDRFLANGKNP